MGSLSDGANDPFWPWVSGGHPPASAHEEPLRQILQFMEESLATGVLNVVALPKFGKTTLLRHASERGGDPHGIPRSVLPVLASFGQRDPGEGLVPFLERRLRERCHELQIPLPNETDARATSSLASTLAQLSQRCVFLCDDFDTAAEKIDERATPSLQALRQYARFVLASPYPVGIPHSQLFLSAFLDDAPTVRLGLLDVDAAQRVLLDASGERGAPFHEQDIVVLLEATGGHPYLTMLGARALWRLRTRLGLLGQESPLNERRRQLLLGQLTEDGHRLFARYWQHLSLTNGDTSWTAPFPPRQVREIVVSLALDEALPDEAFDVVNWLWSSGLARVGASGTFELFSPLFREYVRRMQRTEAETVIPAPARSTTPVLQTEDNETDTALTDTEASLYIYLKRHRERVCTYDELEQAVWRSTGQDRNSAYSTVSRLKRKLEQLTGEDIQNVRGVGYRLVTIYAAGEA